MAQNHSGQIQNQLLEIVHIALKLDTPHELATACEIFFISLTVNFVSSSNTF